MSARVTQSLVAGNLAFLRQGFELIRRLRDEDFVAKDPHGTRGGVGAHFRHVFDHYDCFLEGVAAGRIDYDRRERDAQLETQRARATAKVEDLLRGFEALSGDDSERAMKVLVDCGEPSERCASASTLARELQFLVSHTVHHYAVIAVILRSRGVEPGVDFGVAPSTLKYEQGQAACAR